MTASVRAKHSRNLHHVFVELHEFSGPTSADIQECAEALSHLPLLKYIILKLNRPEDDEGPIHWQPLPQIPFSDLHALRPLRLLEKLVLDGFHVLLSPSDIHTFVSWPNLAELDLLQNTPDASETLCDLGSWNTSCPVTLSLDDVIKLVGMCQRLEVLCVDFHMRSGCLPVVEGLRRMEGVRGVSLKEVWVQTHGCDGTCWEGKECVLKGMFPCARIRNL